MKALFAFLLLLASPCFSQEPATPESQGTNETVAEATRDQSYIPKDLDDCFRELDRRLPPEDIDKIRQGEITTTDMHHGVGMSLRNGWGLWSGSRLKKYFNDMGIFHPDDMSAIILDSYVRHLRNEPIKLDEQVTYYKAYWEKTKATEQDADKTKQGAPEQEQ